MKSLEHFTSLNTALEKFITRENESIALYRQSLHDLGDTVVTPVFEQIIAEKQRHRELLEHQLEELNEHFELDEAII